LAREELATARENCERNRFRTAVSRAYYAVFYIASAALYAQSVQRSKHSGVEAAFSQVLVKPGHIEPEFSRLYYRARRRREEADYADDVVIDEEIALQALADAELFVERLERFLTQVGAL
jgi:uncharacterized protein (UPF0332 family)